MSFFSHIGLSVIDKITDNALDKVGNAIKDGDAKELVSQFTSILDGVEDKLGGIADQFEDAIDDGKKHMRHEISSAKRRLVREARADLEKLHAEFGEKIIEAMRGKVETMIALEVERRIPQALSEAEQIEAMVAEDDEQEETKEAS